MEKFDFRGDEEFTEEFDIRVLKTEMENGPEQRRVKRPLKRVFRLPFSQFADKADEIRDFWLARSGPFEAFLWDHPDTNETITVRFGNDTLSRERIYGKAHSFDIVLQEVLDE